jgi:enoyl reductase-like protein
MTNNEARERIASILREGLIKDFNKLYVKEYTTTWQVERVIRETEIDIMTLENTINQILALLPSLGYRQIDPKKLSVLGDEVIKELAIKPPYVLSDLKWIAKSQLAHTIKEIKGAE